MKMTYRIQARLREARGQAVRHELKHGINGIALPRLLEDVRIWQKALELAQEGREFDRPEAAYYAARDEK